MFGFLLLSFIVTIPIIIELFLLYDRHRIDLLAEALKCILIKRHREDCLDLMLTNCDEDPYPLLRRMLNPIEEFNLNLLLLISLFIDFLISNDGPAKTIMITLLIGLLIINKKMSLKACRTCHRIIIANSGNRILKHFNNRSVLLYGLLIWILTFAINSLIFAFFGFNSRVV